MHLGTGARRSFPICSRRGLDKRSPLRERRDGSLRCVARVVEVRRHGRRQVAVAEQLLHRDHIRAMPEGRSRGRVSERVQALRGQAKRSLHPGELVTHARPAEAPAVLPLEHDGTRRPALDQWR